MDRSTQLGVSVIVPISRWSLTTSFCAAHKDATRAKKGPPPLMQCDVDILNGAGREPSL
jgi:hypothetical protein